MAPIPMVEDHKGPTMLLSSTVKMAGLRDHFMHAYIQLFLLNIQAIDIDWAHQLISRFIEWLFSE